MEGKAERRKHKRKKGWEKGLREEEKRRRKGRN